MTMHKNHRRIQLIDDEGIKSSVWAVVSSVSGDEVSRAEQLGYKAKFRLTLRRAEYMMQTLTEIDGNVYAVYRTYDGGADFIELYCEDKLGVF